MQKAGSSAVIYKLRVFAKPDKHPDLKRRIQGITREVFSIFRGVPLPLI